MMDIPNFDPLIIAKIIILIFIVLVAIIAFIFSYQVKSLNKVITILASFSSGFLYTIAIIYFLAVVSLFFFALVIL